jgi:hypothetical protein
MPERRCTGQKIRQPVNFRLFRVAGIFQAAHQFGETTYRCAPLRVNRANNLLSFSATRQFRPVEVA